MPGPGELAVLIVLTGVVLVSALGIVLWGRARVRGPLRARPAYRGPDPTVVEECLRGLMDAERSAAGGGALGRDDRLDELARHHAHWMSTVARVSAVDDQGRSIEGRRADLHPGLRGPLVERIAGFEPGGPEEPAAAAGLRQELGADAPWVDGERSWAGVGVAAGAGRLWACVVVRSA
jgi:hypothetical protein